MREAGLNALAVRQLPAGAEVAVERPPPGLGRGVFSVRPWLVEFIAVALVLVALGHYVFRLRRPRRR